jgi:hypothetical protein
MAEQPINECVVDPTAILVTPLPIETDVNDVQFEKALVLITVILFGIIIDVKLVQPPIPKILILVIPDPSINDVNPLH